MAVIWNGRMQALLNEGVPVAPVWNQGGLFTDVWAIPEGRAERVATRRSSPRSSPWRCRRRGCPS